MLIFMMEFWNSLPISFKVYVYAGGLGLLVLIIGMVTFMAPHIRFPARKKTEESGTTSAVPAHQSQIT